MKMSKEPLRRFVLQTKKANQIADNKFSKETAKLLGNIAQRKIQEAYQGVDQLTFGVKEANENQVIVYVLDTREKPIIGYLEFGTGMLGEASLYPKLPKESINFFSLGSWQQTEGWQYNYAYNHGIREKPILGQFPKAYFYTTVMTLREELSPFVVDEIKKKLEGNE